MEAITFMLALLREAAVTSLLQLYTLLQITQVKNGPTLYHLLLGVINIVGLVKGVGCGDMMLQN